MEALEKYPQLDAAPPVLIFELILNLTEAHDFERAESLFHNRFFPREEGGTNVRQVWIEVQLQRVLASAREGRCGDALSLAQRLGSEVPGLTFTRDGLEPVLQSARTNYLLGSAYAELRETGASQGQIRGGCGGICSRSDSLGMVGRTEIARFQSDLMAGAPAIFFRSGSESQPDQRLSELVDVHCGPAG